MTDTILRRIESISIKNHGGSPSVTLKTGVEGVADSNGNPTLKPKSNMLDDMGADLPDTSALATELFLRLAGDTMLVSGIKLIYAKTSAKKGLSMTPESVSFDIVIPKGTAALEKDLKIPGITIAIPGQESIEGSGEFATKEELRLLMAIITAVDAHDIEETRQAQLPSPYQQLTLLPAESPDRQSIASKSAKALIETGEDALAA